MAIAANRLEIPNSSSYSPAAPFSINGLPNVPENADGSAKKANAVVHKEGSFMGQPPDSTSLKRKLDSQEANEQAIVKRRKLENNGKEDRSLSEHRRESERSSDSHRRYSSNSGHSHSHSKQDIDMERRREFRGNRDDEYDSHRDKSRYSSDSRSSFDKYESKRSYPYKSAPAEARSSSHTSQIRIHNLPMKGVEYLDYIKSGVKKFEGRVHGHMCASMKAGDHLKLYDNKARRGIICEILSKDVYNSFEAMLRAKGVLVMLPQLKRSGVQQNEEELIKRGVKIYQGFPGSARVTQCGVAAIGVKYLKDV